MRVGSCYHPLYPSRMIFHSTAERRVRGAYANRPDACLRHVDASADELAGSAQSDHGTRGGLHLHL